jgi:hypothetical protein
MPKCEAGHSLWRIDRPKLARRTEHWGLAMKTSDIFLLSNSTYSTPRRTFVGHEKAIAVVSSMLATGLIATWLVAIVVAGSKRSEAEFNREPAGLVNVEHQITRGGSLMGHTAAW